MALPEMEADLKKLEELRFMASGAHTVEVLRDVVTELLDMHIKRLSEEVAIERGG